MSVTGSLCFSGLWFLIVIAQTMPFCHADTRGSSGVLRPKVDACVQMAWDRCQTKCSTKSNNNNNASKFHTCASFVALEICSTSLGLPVNQKKRFASEVVNVVKALCESGDTSSSAARATLRSDARTATSQESSCASNPGSCPKALDDSKVKEPKASTRAALPITYMFQYDAKPETGWFLLDANTSVKVLSYTRTQSPSTPNALLQGSIDLIQGHKYTLFIHDTGNNGICCEHGKGYAKILTADGTALVDFDGVFDSYYSTTFVAPMIASAVKT